MDILMSIKPWYARDIFNGIKTTECRKTAPKNMLPSPKNNFQTDKARVIVYVTNDAGWHIAKGDFDGGVLYTSYDACHKNEIVLPENLRGKIIGEFTCDKISVFGYDENMREPAPAYEGDPTCRNYGPGYWITVEELKKIHILSEEPYKWLMKYGSKKTVYGWNIENPRLYEKPLTLSDFQLVRPPQSWQYILK